MNKTYIFFIFISICTNGWHLCAQNIEPFSEKKISESFTHIPVRDAITTLAKKYGLSFGYSSDLNLDQNINLNFDKSDLNTVLSTLLADSQIEFKIMDTDQVLLRALNSDELWDEQNLSQKYINLKGRITDKLSGEALENAAVFIESSSLGTFTDASGSFHLAIPKKHNNALLTISLLGYEDLLIPAKQLLSDQNVLLNQQYFLMDSISIISRVPVIQMQKPDLATQINFDDHQIRTSSPAGSDVFRNLQLLPGISAHNDDSAELIIRGSDQTQNLIILDGIPIYNANHFYGIYSNINSSYIDKVKLYKNAAPIEYGGKTGGLVLLNSPDETDESFSGDIDVNLLYTSLNLKIPLYPSINLFVAGRTTLGNSAESKFFDFSNALNVENFVDNGLSRHNLIQNTPSFKFNDFNAKLLYDNPDKQQLEFNFFISNDHYFSSYSNTFTSRNQQVVITNEEAFRDEEEWQNTGFSANHNLKINSNFSLHSNLFYSSYENDHNILSSIRRNSSNNPTAGFEIQQSNQISNFGAKINSQISLSSNQNLQLGLFFEDHHISFGFINESVNQLSRDSKAFESGLISEYNIQSGIFNTSFGMRGHYYEGTESWYVSPRFISSLSVSNAWKFKAAFSLDHQFDNQLTHENRLGQSLEYWVLADDHKIPVGESKNYMLGATMNSNLISLDFELFYKDLAGVLEYSILTPGAVNISNNNQNQSYRLFEGTGVSKGIDILLKLERKHYLSWLSYTLSEVTHSFREVYKGVDFPAQEDRRHQLKWINQVKWKNWSLSANYIFTSGRPYLNASFLDGSVDRREISPENMIDRLPDYSRVDIGMNFLIPVNQNKLNLGVSVYNLLNRANVKYLQYIYAIPTTSHQNQNLINTVIGSETNLLDRTLNLSLQFEF